MYSTVARKLLVSGLILSSNVLIGQSAQADVTDFSVTKEIHYEQTSSLPPSTILTHRFAMYLDTSDPSDATSVTVNGDAAIEIGPAAWDYIQDFPDLASLNAAFPASTPYTVAVSGGIIGSLSETVNLPLPQVFPTAPALTPASFDSAQLAPADQDLVIDLLPPDANTNAAFIELYNAKTGDEVVDDDMVLGMPYTVSAGLLESDTQYVMALVYANGAFSEGTPGGFGIDTEIATGYVAITLIEFTTGDGDGEIEFDAGVIKVAGYIQDAPDTQPTTADAWSFEAFYDSGVGAMTMGTVLGGAAPAPMFEYSPGSWDADGPEFTYPTKTQLDADYPSSHLYTMDISGGFLGVRSQPFFIGPDSYPSAPYLVGSSFSDLQGMDASQDLVVSWNAPSAGVNLIGIAIDRTSDLSKVFEAVVSPSAGTSITIPGGMLEAGEDYEFILTFGDLDETNGDGAPGFDTDTILLAGFLSDTIVEFSTQASACTSDLNGDGSLDFFDVSAFLVAFGNNDLVADFNGDGLLDFFDVSAFLIAFGAGCP